MALEKKVDLKIKANQIQNETAPGANTCLRNGIMLNNIIDSMMAIFGVTVAELDALRVANAIDQRTNYVLSNAVGGTKVLQLRAGASNSTVFFAIDLVAGTTGIYVLASDLYTATTQQGNQTGFTPALATDGSCIVSASNFAAEYTRAGDRCIIMAQAKLDVDFSSLGGDNGDFSFNVPFVSASSSFIGTVSFAPSTIPFVLPLSASMSFNGKTLSFNIKCGDTALRGVSIQIQISGQYQITV